MQKILKTLILVLFALTCFTSCKNKTITSIEILNLPDKVTYNLNEQLDLSNGKIKVNYSDNSSEEINITLKMVSGFNSSIPGEQSINITYMDKVTYFKVNVINDKTITSINITSLPNKLTYFIGEDLDLTNGKIKVNYSDSSSDEIAIESNMVKDFDNTVLGEQLITITYLDKTITFKVIVETPPIGLEFKLNGDNNSYEVSAGAAIYERNIEIPSTYNGLPVTKIKDYGFKDCYVLENITIPNSIDNIGLLAFENCNRIKTNQYDNALYLGNSDNPYLVLLHAKSEDITSCQINENTKIISTTAFESCSELLTISIPNSVVSIGAGVFVNCTKLKDISIPNSIKHISFQVFEECNDIQYNEYDNALYLGNLNNPYLVLVKAKSKNITSCQINENTKAILENAFMECINLETITIPNSVESIGPSAFMYCGKLKNISLPNSLTGIDNQVFAFCSSLENIVLPNSVTYIGTSSFSYCTSLKTIKIPNTITSIGDAIFSGCTSLTNITTDKAEIPSINGMCVVASDGTIVKENGIALIVKNGNELTLKSVAPSIKTINIPNIVTHIGNYVFYNYTNLTNINLSNAIIDIGQSVFTGCNNLVLNEYDNALYLGSNDKPCLILFTAKDKNIETCSINETTRVILDGAFSECKNLKAISIPNEVTTIKNLTFSECSNLEKVTLSNNLKSIGEYAFRNCNNIKSLTIPKSIKYIGENFLSDPENLSDLYYDGTIEDWCKIDFAGSHFLNKADNFYINNELVTRVDIPSSIKELKPYTFSFYEKLESVNIPEGVLKLCDEVFNGCQNLSRINSEIDGEFILPNSIISIEESVFEGNANVKSIRIPSSLVHIGPNLFRGYSTLENVYYEGTISDWCNISISNYSTLFTTEYTNFYINNELITQVEIPPMVTEIKDFAFSCDNFVSIIIPNSVTSIGDRALDSTNLCGIYLPITIKDMYYSAFGNCSSLCQIYYGGSEEDFNKINMYGLNNEYLSNVNIIYNVDINDVSFRFIKDDNFSYVLTHNNEILGFKCHNKSIKDCDLSTIFNEYKSVFFAKDAFKECLNLETIILPSNLKNIASHTFSNCSKLKSVTIPNGITSIGGSAFVGCSSLESVEIPNSVTSIGYDAFSGCTSLTKVNITDIEAWCNISFSNYSSNPLYYGHNLYLNNVLITELVIPSSVTSIGDSVFSGCSSLTSVEIPNSVTSIGYDAFSGCTSLTSVEIPNSVTSIGYSAFSRCSSLTSVEIPNSVTSIGDYAFNYCNKLISITIPNGVTSIGKRAFYNCNKVTIYCEASSIPTGWDFDWNYDNRPVVWNCNLSSDKTYVVSFVVDSKVISEKNVELPYRKGYSLFAWCDNPNLSGERITNLKEVENNTTLYAIWVNEDFVEEPTPGLLYSYITDTEASVIGIGTAYMNKIIIPATYNGFSITSIGDNAFYECSNLTSVTIPDSVTSIGNSAFYSCSNLASVTIPNSVTSIGNFVFYSCSNITSIEIPESVTSIGYNVLSRCSSLESIIVDSNNTIYDSRDNCNAIIETSTNTLIYGCKKTIIPNSVISIGNDAFYGCSSLISIEIPNSVTNIGECVFAYCSNLINVIYEVNSKLESIGYEAFIECTSLTSIGIPNSVISIGDDAFHSCSGLTNVIYEVNSKLESIGYGAFIECTSLTSIGIPNSVISIGDDAFHSCSGLTSVIYEANSKLESIGRGTFNSCSSLTSIEIPNNIINIRGMAFDSCSSLKNVTFETNSGLEIIEGGAFDLCSALTSIIIPSSVITIGHSAFSRCNNLTIYTESVIKPDSWHEFWNCYWSGSDPTPVIWGCSLSDDKTYVVSFNKISSSINSLDNLNPPYRDGYNFEYWCSSIDGSKDKYYNIKDIPDNTLVYAYYLKVE